MSEQTCVLMFSGGRDSSLAAARLAREWDKLILVTVTSGGLVGIDRVIRRLSELTPLLRDNTAWIHVRLAQEPERAKAEKTCLTCHQAYIVAGAKVADKFQAMHIALGYSGYQSGWAEQTPYAIDKLKEVLMSNGFTLVLPVSNILLKEDAIHELHNLGLSEQSLEQRCVKQIIDPGLTGQSLHREVDEWSSELMKAMAKRHTVKLDIEETRELSDRVA